MRYLILLIIPLFIFINLNAQEKVASLELGDRPSAYVFEDLADKVRSLDEFKGKFILIDVWASWCTPCQREFPALDELRNHYKDRDLVVLGLSVYNTRYRWIGACQHFKLPEPQFIVAEEERFEQEFGINYIPRMILLDKEGRVLNEGMPKPSDPQIYEILNGVLYHNIK